MKKIRISAAGLVRIEINNKILLILNKARRTKGTNIYTAPGGALQFHKETKKLLQQLQATFEHKNDLRIEIPEKNLKIFERWFNKRTGRETNPYRELEEELVQEERALTKLEEKEITLTYKKTIKEKEKTDRPTQKEKETQRYIEIYHATLTKKQEKEIQQTTNKNLLLATTKEIEEGKTNTGITIAKHCKALIEKN